MICSHPVDEWPDSMLETCVAHLEEQLHRKLVESGSVPAAEKDTLRTAMNRLRRYQAHHARLETRRGATHAPPDAFPLPDHIQVELEQEARLEMVLRQQREEVAQLEEELRQRREAEIAEREARWAADVSPDDIARHKQALRAFYTRVNPAMLASIDRIWSIHGPRVWESLEKKYPGQLTSAFIPRPGGRRSTRALLDTVLDRRQTYSYN